MKVKELLNKKEYKEVVFKAIDITPLIPENDKMNYEVINRAKLNENGKWICPQRDDFMEYEPSRSYADGDTLMCYIEIEQDVEANRFEWIKWQDDSPEYDTQIWLKLYSGDIYEAIKVKHEHEDEYERFMCIDKDRRARVIDIDGNSIYQWGRRLKSGK